MFHFELLQPVHCQIASKTLKSKCYFFDHLWLTTRLGQKKVSGDQAPAFFFLTKPVLSVGNYFFILRILLKEEAFFADLVFLQKFILKRVPTLPSFLNTLFLSVSLIFKKLLSHFFLALICLVSVVPHNIVFSVMLRQELSYAILVL